MIHAMRHAQASPYIRRIFVISGLLILGNDRKACDGPLSIIVCAKNTYLNSSRCMTIGTGNDSVATAHDAI